MRAMLFLLRRCLLPSSGNLLGFALWIAVAGVALGITQLMVVLSVMSGFQKMLRHAYTRISSEIIVVPRFGLPQDPDFRRTILAVPGVQAATPTSLGQGMAMKDGAVGGVVFEGIDWETSKNVTPWDEVWVEKPDFAAQAKEPDWMWIGAQLAQKLHAKRGDTINVLIADAQGRRVIPFRVTGITKFGIYDHDMRYARISYERLAKLYERGDREAMWKIRVDPLGDPDATAARLEKAMGPRAQIKRWSDVNQNIFLAVQHQKGMLFAVLEIVVALAAMNVVNLLMMSSHHRRRDVAILRAMGMRFRSVIAFFTAQGAAVGSVGIALGVALGLVACKIIEQVQPKLLAEAVYNTSQLPIRVELRDVLLVCAAGFVLCLVFSIIPAIGAAIQRPVDAIRYE